jgi:hypothetical protein
MAVMTESGVYPVILGILRKHSSGLTPAALISAVSGPSGGDDREVKRAIWRLIAEQKIELSSQRLLVPAASVRRPTSARKPKPRRQRST